MLSQVDALQTEYSAPPREPSPAQQKLPVFLLPRACYPVRDDCYVDLIRGEAISSEFAGLTLRTSDWYARMEDDRPQQVVNETYS